MATRPGAVALIAMVAAMAWTSVDRAQATTIDVMGPDRSGEKVQGPTLIHIIHLNRLRYDLQVGVEVTYAPGPSLNLPFLPPVAAAAALDADAAGKRGPILLKGIKVLDLAGRTIPNSVIPGFEEFVSRHDDIEMRRDTLEHEVRRVLATVASAGSSLLQLLLSSDVELERNRATGLIAQLTPLAANVRKASAEPWPAADALNDDVLRLQAFVDIQVIKNPKEWKEVYEHVTNLVSALRSRVASGAAGSDRARAWRTQVEALQKWAPMLEGWSHASAQELFETEVPVDCSMLASESKKAIVRLARTDRIHPETVYPKRDLITVECPSRLAVTAGFGFSNVREKEYQLVPSQGGPGGEIAFKKSPSSSEFPVVLLHTRLAQWRGRARIALHLTVGGAVALRDGASKAEPEWLLGMSGSAWSTLFASVLYHIGRTTELADGYDVGDPVPSGTSEAPVLRASHKGLGIALSYKIR
jgi:hypothetical protein